MAENQADNPVQELPAPQPPRLHSLRPHKLRRFSGDEGDAEDFLQEAKLFLQLQPMTDPVSAGWLLGALEGRARQEILAMEAEEANPPAKIVAILEQHWGEHRDSSTLAEAFFRRQQELTESVGEYASNFRLLWAKTNFVKPDTLSEVMLRDTLAGGLHPASLKRDMKKYMRQNADSTYSDVKKEALRWMREDSCPDTTTEQLVVPNHDGLKRLKTQTAALLMETASLKQELRQQSDSKATPDQCHIHCSSNSTPTHNGGPRNLDCSWCQRRGHTK